MSLASVVVLLQTALSLLVLVNSNPSLPQSMRDNAQQVAQQAIAQATTAIAATKTIQTSNIVPTATTTTTLPTMNPNANLQQINDGSASAPTSTSSLYKTPAVKVTANPTNIKYGDTATISWVATDAMSCTFGSSSTLLAPEGSQSVNPTYFSKDWSKTSTTTYTVTCTGAGGSASGGAKVTIQPWVPSTECVKLGEEMYERIERSELSPELCVKLIM